jgi:hypothetical protein
MTVMGEFNSIVEEGSTNKVVGPFGLCRRNERATSAYNTIWQR